LWVIFALLDPDPDPYSNYGSGSGSETLLCTVTTTKRFYFSPPLPRSKSGSKLVCNVNIVYGNLKSENSQDYAQKPQRNCMFMKVASDLPITSCSISPAVSRTFFCNVCFRYYRSFPFFSVLTATVPAFLLPEILSCFSAFAQPLRFFAALLSFSFKLSAPYIAFCFSHIRLLSNFPAFLCSYSYLKTVLDSFWIAYTVFRLPFPCISWFISQLFKRYVT
jgi:hypothetical protein